MPKEIFRSLQKVRVRGTELRISRVDSRPPRSERAPRGPRPPPREGAHKAGRASRDGARKSHPKRKGR
jgi:hypothetical protein